MKKIVVFIALIYTSTHARHKKLLNSLQKKCDEHTTLLVSDCSQNLIAPPLNNFRIIHNNAAPLTKKALSAHGLEKLHASGSAQFNHDHLKKITKKIRKLNPTAPIYVVDLRQEYHGFLGSQNQTSFPISWYKSSMNCINWNKYRTKIKDTETVELNKLREQGTAQLYIKNAKEWPLFGEPVIQKPTLSFSLYIQQAYTEKHLVNQEKHNYKRFYVADRQAPTPQEVNRFINFAKNIPPNAWLHFHCRAGLGRTTTFLIMYDMMHNAHILDANTIIQRQELLNKYPVTELRGDPILKKFKIERLTFLHDFYHYTHKHAPDFSLSFSEWQANK
jgi:protein-tyrosine phosphatase